MRQRLIGCATLTGALVLLSAPARADKESLTLEYQAAVGCPDRARFIERVHTFTTKAEVADDDGTPRRKFGIRVTRAAGAVTGELAIDDRGARTTRSVSGATCDEVVSALALATALAVDPDALSGEPPTESTPAEPALPAAPPKPAPPKPAPAAPKLAPPPSAVAKPPLAAPAPKLAHRYALDFSLGARVGDSVAPFPLLETVAEVGTTYFAPLDLHAGIVFAPAQRDRQAEFADLLGWVGAGYRLLDLELLSVWGQTGLELGRVQAVGREVNPTYRVNRLWAAVDVGLSARLDAPGRLFFQANASGRAPLSLQRYVVQENTGKLRELHQVQQLGYLLGISVGMHFL